MPYSEVLKLYSQEKNPDIEIKETSRGENDYRIALFVQWPNNRLVIKITDNDFTTEERVECWAKTIEEYLTAGFYCPEIVKNKNGDYTQTVSVNGRNCLVYAEEYSKYKTAEQFEPSEIKRDGEYVFLDDVIRSIGVIGSKHLRTALFPSGMCIFEKFSPSDPCDEVMENALLFKQAAEEFPTEQKKVFEKLWSLYIENQKKLEAVYPDLPASVFQADLNPTNILLDRNGKFVGMLDFNLCGKDTVLNYTFRELMCRCHFGKKEILYNQGEIDKATKMFLCSLQTAAQTYTFSKTEKEAAILLYRYLRPFWWSGQEAERIKNDAQKVLQILDWARRELTRTDICFEGYLET